MNGPTYGSLFSGYGGLDLAIEQLFGARCAWHSEIDPHASTVLAHHWPKVPNHGDIAAIDWAAVEPVDIIAGGFPCQDISTAGRQAGIKEGTRSGLWYRYADAVRVLRPRLVVVENVSALLAGGGLGVVLGSLAAVGYDAWWGSLPASAVGACHRRTRVFIVAAPPDDGPAPDAVRERVGQHAGGPPAKEARTHGGDLAGDHRGERPAVDGRPLADLNLLPTPTTQPATGNGHARSLGAELALLPTPLSSLGRGTGMPSIETARRRRDDEGRRSLDEAVVLLPTPTVGDSKAARDSTANRAELDWGRYAAAIARWETATGRRAPMPTDEKGRLNPVFVEWMMGCPEGWVTGHGLPRTAELRMLGNGVVTQQATAACAALHDRMRRHTTAAVS